MEVVLICVALFITLMVGATISYYCFKASMESEIQKYKDKYNEINAEAIWWMQIRQDRIMDRVSGTRSHEIMTVHTDPITVYLDSYIGMLSNEDMSKLVKYEIATNLAKHLVDNKLVEIQSRDSDPGSYAREFMGSIYVVNPHSKNHYPPIIEVNSLLVHHIRRKENEENKIHNRGSRNW